MEEDVERISLIDFMEVFESSIVMGDGRHLWDWLNYNEYIKTFDDDDEE